MIERVAEDQAALPHKRRDHNRVGCKPHAEGDDVLTAYKVCYLPVKIKMLVCGACSPTMQPPCSGWWLKGSQYLCCVINRTVVIEQAAAYISNLLVVALPAAKRLLHMLPPYCRSTCCTRGVQYSSAAAKPR